MLLSFFTPDSRSVRGDIILALDLVGNGSLALTNEGAVFTGQPCADRHLESCKSSNNDLKDNQIMLYQHTAFNGLEVHDRVETSLPQDSWTGLCLDMIRFHAYGFTFTLYFRFCTSVTVETRIINY